MEEEKEEVKEEQNTFPIENDEDQRYNTIEFQSKYLSGLANEKGSDDEEEDYEDYLNKLEQQAEKE